MFAGSSRSLQWRTGEGSRVTLCGTFTTQALSSGCGTGLLPYLQRKKLRIRRASGMTKTAAKVHCAMTEGYCVGAALVMKMLSRRGPTVCLFAFDQA